MTTPEQLAKLFHDTYERLAPQYGYKTRKASSLDWDEVPELNKELMIETCKVILKANVITSDTLCPLCSIKAKGVMNEVDKAIALKKIEECIVKYNEKNRGGFHLPHLNYVITQLQQEDK